MKPKPPSLADIGDLAVIVEAVRRSRNKERAEFRRLVRVYVNETGEQPDLVRDTDEEGIPELIAARRRQQEAQKFLTYARARLYAAIRRRAA